MKCSFGNQIYLSHFLSSWGDRMWMFSGGLFLIEITPGSLRLVALYESFLSLTVICCGAAIGRWIDRTGRFKAAQLSLLLQNVMVCLCTLLLCLLITYKDLLNKFGGGWGEVVMKVGIILLACFAQIGTLGSKLSIEKDWIVVISNFSGTKLSTMNSVLRVVDLSTEVVAPVVVGFIMTSFGMVVGGITIASWNVISLGVEYALLRSLYRRVEALRNPKPSSRESPMTSLRERMSDTLTTWRSYFGHRVRNAGFSFAFLFMTVLALDNYSRAYIYENGVSKGVLGLLTALASLSGISGSLAFPILTRKIGLLKTGVLGFIFETACLSLCVASVFAPGSLFQSNIFIVINDTELVNLPLAPSISSDVSYVGADSDNEISREKACNVTRNSYTKDDSGTTHRLSHPNTLFYLRTEIESLIFSSRSSTQGENSFILDKNCSIDQFTVGQNDDISLSTRNFTSPDLYHYYNSRDLGEEVDSKPLTSIILLLVGIISSRFGLWVADLTVTLILQEHVSENERGAINGVQSSLNQSFSLLRSILLIALPSMSSFGYHIILSFLFVTSASVLFVVYSLNDQPNPENEVETTPQFTSNGNPSLEVIESVLV